MQNRLALSLLLLTAPTLMAAECDDGTAGMEATAGSGGQQGSQGGEGSYVPVACGDTGELLIGAEALGKDERMKISLVEASPAPPQKYENDWTIQLSDMDGEPVTDATITEVEPFMTVHGHDGLFIPEVASADGAGQFQVDRINMWMGGPWEVRFTVDSESLGEDYIVFQVCIPE